MMKKITIAIDGFSACGKSTMAKDLANKIGYIYIDSGAMYRAVTLYAIQNNLTKDNNVNANILENKINDIKIEFKINEQTTLPETYLNGKNVEKDIRTMEVSGKVSQISTLAFVRKAMVKQQQAMGKLKGIVMDGRDIGTAVFPDAELKIFVTARPEVRAKRRLDELRFKGDCETPYEDILKNLQQRDYIDQNRTESPLVQAKDALVLDNSDITQEQQAEWLLNQFNLIINNE